MMAMAAMVNLSATTFTNLDEVGQFLKRNYPDGTFVIHEHGAQLTVEAWNGPGPPGANTGGKSKDAKVVGWYKAGALTEIDGATQRERVIELDNTS